jgi:hypothetical protein
MKDTTDVKSSTEKKLLSLLKFTNHFVLNTCTHYNTCTCIYCAFHFLVMLGFKSDLHIWGLGSFKGGGRPSVPLHALF